MVGVKPTFATIIARAAAGANAGGELALRVNDVLLENVGGDPPQFGEIADEVVLGAHHVVVGLAPFWLHLSMVVELRLFDFRSYKSWP